MSTIAIRVTCYAGYRSEETPRRLDLGARSVEVRHVLDRWLAPDYRYFKVQGTDGALYIIRNDLTTYAWELTLYRSAECQTHRPNEEPLRIEGEYHV